jgi:hypothetical protein
MADALSATPPQEEPKTAPPRRLVNIIGIRIGYALGGLAWLMCFVVASQMDGAAWLNILTCLFGSTIGWWAGILISPDPSEKGQFLEFRRSVSAFLSGFVLAKLDLLFQGAVAHDLAASPIFIGRLFLFATTSLICAQFTYVARHDLAPQSLPAAVSVSAAADIPRTQRLVRLLGVAVVLVALMSLVYVNYRHLLNVEQSVILLLFAVGAIALTASTTTIRKWLLGKTG